MTSSHPKIYRSHEIQRIRQHLERDGFPRLQMLLLVTLTGAAGFVTSYLLLSTGVGEMWLRYLASISIAYLMFLFLLWLWLRTKAEDYTDFPDISGGVPSHSEAGTSSNCFSGGGGEAGGGGASSSFDIPSENISIPEDAAGSMGDALGAVAQAEEFAVPLFAIILIGTLLLSSLFIIYSAPILFAELLVDGVLSASLYRKLRGLETRHWLETAVHRTVWPFILTATIFSATGWAMTLYAPEAHTIGDVIYHSKQIHKSARG